MYAKFLLDDLLLPYPCVVSTSNEQCGAEQNNVSHKAKNQP